jgi:hypothetical protein
MQATHGNTMSQKWQRKQERHHSSAKQPHGDAHNAAPFMDFRPKKTKERPGHSRLSEGFNIFQHIQKKSDK